ncbi:hypothetical protein DY000_02037713 [Brassica cretica]|uniref:Uncharacterized protein n=1 Tax=Brassica cretica TaxID=69181 RepID=A0ABQ7B4R1_BRACR|nr:hypothetical protein DY000_02037713 [Brassica cretica]
MNKDDSRDELSKAIRRRAATSSSRSERSLQASGATWRGRCETSLWVALRERPRLVAPVTSLRVMETRATSLCRSGHVASGDGDTSDFAVSLRPRRSG